jgi:membrane-associated phospholipid phosphatase
VLVAYGCGLVLKNLIRRPRPAPADGPALVTPPTQLSFPSSHATTSFAAASAFGPLIGRRRALTALATAMSASRIYLGVHYPSDVVAGALLGTAVGRGHPSVIPRFE